MAHEREKSLLHARRRKDLEVFIREHEGDPQGDNEKLDAIIKHPFRESGPEVPPASSRGASGD